MFLNFGDLGQNAKEFVEQFASKQVSGQKLDSIEDMKRFVEEFPEFRRLSSNVTKHVTLVTELSRRVGTDNLLDVSELEQSLLECIRRGFGDGLGGGHAADECDLSD